MEILYLLIPVSIILISLAVWLLNWAVSDGQFDDMEGPGHSLLFDDDDTTKFNHKPPSGSPDAPGTQEQKNP